MQCQDNCAATRPLETEREPEEPQCDEHAHEPEHNHTPNHNHAHSHHNHMQLSTDGKLGTAFTLAFLLTAGFVLIEFAAGFWFNSLALVSDAGHNLSDALALAVSWVAIRIASRAANYAKTYGYRRATILAAIFNAVTLILVSVYIFYEAIHRLINPPEIEGWAVIGVASLALVVNLMVAGLLRQWAAGDLNSRSAFLHVITDAMVSVGVIIAGAVQLLTGWRLVDPIISIVIGVFIIWSAWGITKEALNVLLEGIPAGLNITALEQDLKGYPRVQGVHDLHVWTIDNSFLVLSCHMQIGENCTLIEANQLLQSVNLLLEKRYNIRHSTVQLEA